MRQAGPWLLGAIAERDRLLADVREHVRGVVALDGGAEVKALGDELIARIDLVLGGG